MLNLTSSMAVAFRSLAESGFRPHGDLLYFAVADEEAGSAHGARWVADNHPDAIYRPNPRFHELWRPHVESLDIPDEIHDALLDESAIDEFLAALPAGGTKSYLHACTHTTFSPNVVDTVGRPKTNVIPDTVDIDIDIRTMPGDMDAEVEAHLRAAIGDELFDAVDVEILIDDLASTSRVDTPLWDALQRAVNVPFPDVALSPQFAVGFTDARVFRDLGAISYGAGLCSPALDAVEFSRRFHGHNERIDIESLRLTTELWNRVARDLLGG